MNVTAESAPYFLTNTSLPSAYQSLLIKPSIFSSPSFPYSWHNTMKEPKPLNQQQQKQLPQNRTEKAQLPVTIKPSKSLDDQQNQTKPKHNNLTTTTTTNNSKQRVIWDCGSSLYDSFERNSFQKQLDSAIINSSRTFSMPRLPSEEGRVPLPQPPPSKKPSSSKLSRSFQKLLRSVFRGPKLNNLKPNSGSSSSSSPDPWFLDPLAQEEKHMKVGGDQYYAVYEKSNGLSTIPEVPEVAFSPEYGSLVRKTMSERFTATSVGISCA